MQRINTVLSLLTLGAVLWLGFKPDAKPVGRYLLAMDATGNVTVLDTVSGEPSSVTVLEGRPVISHVDLITERFRVRQVDGKMAEYSLGKQHPSSPKP